MKIMVCMRQIGGANAVIPVARKLRQAGNQVSFYSQGVADKRFSTEFPLIFADQLHVSRALSWISPDVVLIECVSPEEKDVIPLYVVNEVVERNIPVVVVQDFWGSGLSIPWENRPDVICVQDELAEKLVRSAWLERDYGVEITGQPAFDNMGDIDCEGAEMELRAMFDLKENWPIVHYNAGYKGTADSISTLVQALNYFQQPVYLFIRFHPRMMDINASEAWKAEYQRYQELNPVLKYGQAINTSGKDLSDLINAASRIVAGTYPTMIVQACYLRKACLSIMNEVAQKQFEIESSGILKAFPPTMLGCCYEATSVDETVKCLEKIFNGETLWEAQKKHFVSDGKSAERVAEIVAGL